LCAGPWGRRPFAPPAVGPESSLRGPIRGGLARPRCLWRALVFVLLYGTGRGPRPVPHAFTEGPGPAPGRFGTFARRPAPRAARAPSRSIVPCKLGPPCFLRGRRVRGRGPLGSSNAPLLSPVGLAWKRFGDSSLSPKPGPLFCFPSWARALPQAPLFAGSAAPQGGPARASGLLNTMVFPHANIPAPKHLPRAGGGRLCHPRFPFRWALRPFSSVCAAALVRQNGGTLCPSRRTRLL